MECIEHFTNNKPLRLWKLILFFACIVLLSIFIVFVAQRSLEQAPSSFPLNTEIVIEEGHSISSVTELLAEQHVVKSSLYLYLVLVHTYGGSYIKAGTYLFDVPVTTHEIASAITSGKQSTPLISVTLPEGFQTKNISKYLPESLSGIDDEEIHEYEGYLFPDTYFVSKDTTSDEFRALLLKTNNEKIAPYSERILNSGFTQDQVVILASILEREANDVVSKRIVSGILQHRLELGMPLQVDATFDYILDKNSSELTIEDLRIDSPYNTYLYKGLPPTPIANPGIESIEAVLEPEITDYLYYLTSADGTFYYARTFEQHKVNKKKYLQ